MSRARPALNLAIIVLIAAAVYAIPGGGRVASTFEAVLLVGFGVAFAYLGARLYREHRVALHGLGDQHRAALYGALAVVVFIIMARGRMWHTSLGELVWFMLLGAVVYTLAAVYRHWRAY